MTVNVDGEYTPAVTECLLCGWALEGDDHYECLSCFGRDLVVYARQFIPYPEDDQTQEEDPS